MKRRRKSRGLLGFAVFVVFVLVGGYALNLAGYDDNPFDEIAFLSNWTNGGEQRFAQDFVSETGASDFSLSSPSSAGAGIDLTGLNESNSPSFQLPASGELDSANLDAAPGFQSDAFDGAGSDDQNAVAWADFGDVLYDLWFICATTAIFIVVQQLFRLSMKQIRSRLLAVAAVH